MVPCTLISPVELFGTGVFGSGIWLRAMSSSGDMREGGTMLLGNGRQVEPTQLRKSIARNSAAEKSPTREACVGTITLPSKVPVPGSTLMIEEAASLTAAMTKGPAVGKISI